jgi:YidC/Oxa1 family membrane protein insertase
MDNKNLIVALFLSVAIMTGWNYFFEKPRLEKIAAEKRIIEQQFVLKQETKGASSIARDRASIIKDSGRILIESPCLSGSINLRGVRFDDMTLLGYKQTLDDHSLDVNLFSPSGAEGAYFAEFGWYSSSYHKLPDASTIWSADGKKLSPERPVILSWTNSDGVKFNIKISIDKDYMFSMEQSVENNSDKELHLKSYGLINRSFAAEESGGAANNILHQGPLAVVGSELKEETFDKIKGQKRMVFDMNKLDWIGISDKYWLSSFVPDQKLRYNSHFNYAIVGVEPKYQVDFLSEEIVIRPHANVSLSNKLFAGAKKVNLLDQYKEVYNIKLFDRAIDFGWFYYFTKPMFHALNFFYNLFGNFGLSILFVTVVVKILMFGFANKSYKSMQQMKELQPEVERLKSSYGNDQVKFNQEVMELYKKKKVNPLSGCLPLLLQIPVFFSLYKVLYVTIEMRHSPFYGWIGDLSAPDPTSLFNLFGLLPFTPPSMLMIGAWPVMMAFSMFLQQRMSPPPADPIQAKMMAAMPLILLVMFSSFPAGLVIYWTWNNILSIAQQKLVTR